MKIKLISTLCILTAFTFCAPSLNALKPRSKYFKSEEEANHYLTKHYNLGCKYYNCESWRSAAPEFEKVIFYFPCSDAAAEASYYLAVCYFEMKEYDFANEEFSNYLKASQHPAFFEDAVSYKFCIAEHFKRGKKRRPFKMRYLPKWISAQDSALTIYDEVVAAFPNNELAIQALYSKADLLKRMEEYRDCVETYQTIIRRFPKNEIVPACYLNIADAYIQQSRLEFQNPDILALAELNARKFGDDFPRDERVAIAEESVCSIKEMYAKGLCDLGLFYERTGQPQAAAIYFQSSIEEFPDTRVATFCRSRLICLGYLGDAEEEAVPCSDEAVPPPMSETGYEDSPVNAEAPFYGEAPQAPAYNEGSFYNETSQVPSYNENSFYNEAPQAPAYNESSFYNEAPQAPAYNEGSFYNQAPQTPAYNEGCFYNEVPQALSCNEDCFYSESLPPPPQVQEYVHYSLTKKREMGQRECEQPQMSGIIEGELPPCPQNAEEDQSLELWHYSAIKHRDQHAPCQD